MGIKMDFDPDLIIPDTSKSIADGTVALYKNALDGWRGQYLASVAKHLKFSIFTPIKDLSKSQLHQLLYGSEGKLQFKLSMRDGNASWSHYGY